MPKTDTLTERNRQYIFDHALRPHPILMALVTTTRQLPFGRMSTQLDEINFITFLLKSIHARNVIEVGVLTGCATLGMALALPDEGKIIACDIDERWPKIGRDYWQRAQVDHKISLHIAPATETLKTLIENGQTNHFDAIFIDADKCNYPTYYALSLSLLRQGGLIIIDNMLWGGKVADESVQDEQTQAIRETLTIMQSDQRIDLSLVPIGDGIALARKR